MKCQYPVYIQHNLEGDPASSVHGLGCPREATHVERNGWFLACAVHQPRFEQDHDVRTDELRCERVVREGNPQDLCGKPAEYRTRDSFLSCEPCRSERVSDGELPADAFIPLEPHPHAQVLNGRTHR